MRSIHPFVLAALSAAAPAQTLVVGDPAGAPFAELIGQSPLYPGMAPPVNAYPQAPPLPSVPGLVPVGAVTVDGTNGLTWYTDGVTIATTPYNGYPIAPPIVPPYPAVLFGGPITGMALDPVGGVLWMTDGILVAGFPPGAPGAPPVVPPFAPIAPVPFGALTGLDWDPLTGTLWACDIAGVCINFVPGGPPAGPPLMAPGGGPFTGIAIDKTGNAPLGVRPLYVAGAGLVIEAGTGAAAPIPFPMAMGLSYNPVPAAAPSPAPCPCPGMPIGLQLRGPMITGNPAFGVDMTGLAPGQLTLVIFDYAFNPAFPMVNGVGCPLGFVFGSPFLGTRFAFANAAGVAASPFNLTGVPVGLNLYVQIGTTCAADPVGVVLSPLYQFIVSAP